jgi:protein-S-isoprenylcysteine O-methyltransferase Ste14
MSVARQVPRWRARFAAALARSRARLAVALARRRVFLGFLFGALALWLAEPTWQSVARGGAITAVGEALRVWAAGHIEKGREVTRSGPYRFTRHPLYLGSSIIGAGIAIACASWLVAALVALYLATTLAVAIRAEEAHLREKFGAAYDAYAGRTAAPMIRTFSAARAVANREHHTLAGLVAALALLALKVRLSLP